MGIFADLIATHHLATPIDTQLTSSTGRVPATVVIALTILAGLIVSAWWPFTTAVDAHLVFTGLVGLAESVTADLDADAVSVTGLVIADAGPT